MGECASYKAKVDIKVKVIEKENGVEFGNIKYLGKVDEDILSSEEVINLLKKYKQNLLLKSEYDTIKLKWNEEYENGIPEEAYEQMMSDIAYCHRSKVYRISKIKVSEKQVEDLKLDSDTIIEEGYIIANKDNEFCKSIYCDDDNFFIKDITFLIEKTIEIKKMGYGYKVILKTDGQCNC